MKNLEYNELLGKNIVDELFNRFLVGVIRDSRKIGKYDTHKKINRYEGNNKKPIDEKFYNLYKNFLDLQYLDELDLIISKNKYSLLDLIIN